MDPEVTTTPPEITTRSTGVRYGLINGVIGIVVFLGLNLSGVDMTEGPARWIGILVSAVVLYLAHQYFKQNGNGYMSYGQGIGIALWMGIVSSVISSIFTYIYVKFIDTEFLNAIREKQEEAMAERGMSDEQIEQAMKFAEMFSTAEAMLIFGLVFGIIGMIIIGLLVSIFTKKQSPETAF
jgi:hypothetical protein